MHVEDRLSHNWLFKKLLNESVCRESRHLHGLVVDLGCGTRPYESKILERAACYIGIDWNNTPHEMNADVVADVSNPLPLRDGIVDCVTSFEVIEHVPEPAMMLSEAYRVLKSGGLLLLTAPFQWWVHEEPWDFQRFTRYGLDYQLRKAGFVDIVVVPITGFWSMWTLKLNYQLARLVRGSWFRRKVASAILIPVWWMGQMLAQYLDRFWKEDRETAGYIVTARKA